MHSCTLEATGRGRLGGTVQDCLRIIQPQQNKSVDAGIWTATTSSIGIPINLASCQRRCYSSPTARSSRAALRPDVGWGNHHLSPKAPFILCLSLDLFIYMLLNGANCSTLAPATMDRVHLTLATNCSVAHADLRLGAGERNRTPVSRLDTLLPPSPQFQQ